MQRVFGPVPSRRLGRSLGVNNIPPKVCSYSCVYCQLGRAIEMTAQRREFFDPESLIAEAGEHLSAAQERGDRVDYLTIVPDGEPTLDTNLDRLVEGLATLGVPVALITNSSLMGDEEVRAAVAGVDWISVKVDAPDERTWKRIDRPHRRLDFNEIMTGLRMFADGFDGTLTTETMLVDGVNDGTEQVEAAAEIIAELGPDVSYISIPTRPPAESWAQPASEQSVARAYGAFASRGLSVENLIGYEGNEFAASGDAREDLLGITAVHPMRREAVEEILRRDGASETELRDLIDTGEVVEVEFAGNLFYVRGFRK
ncbi:MAG: radical SAM protein [Spirochaetes bacterium]|nr:radical SAM protein [Spirochaetota bacterium]